MGNRVFREISERRRLFSWNKLSNRGQNKFDMLLRRRRLSSYPHFIVVEPCNICNLKCPLCTTGQRLPVEKRGTMSMETFIRIVDQLSAYVRYMSLYYHGEPLFCEQLPEMIRYARQHKIRTFVSSNLNILNEKMAEDLIESRLDYLIVSLDGTTQESYEKYRIGGNFDKVVSNIRLINERKLQKNSPWPRIVMQPVILKHNEHEVPKLRELADSLGVKMFLRQGMLGGEGHTPPVTKDYALARKWLSQNREYHKDYDYLSDRPYLKKEPCFYLWRAVAINWDGTVFPCCWLHEKKYSVGNILEQDFKTIWNNEMYVSSRSLFARRKSTFLKSRGNLPETICYKCKIFRHNLNGR